MAARSALLLYGLLAARAALADGFEGGMIPTDHITVPNRPPAGVVALMSDSAGWGAAEDALAASLQATGIAVIGIDLPAYDAALEAAPGDCVYLISDIERLSHQIQRASGGASYHAPILAGVGAAGGLALDLVDQTPAATVGGTVVTDPSVGVALRKPLCTCAQHRESAGGTVYSLPSGTPADRVSIGLTADVAQAVRDRVDDFKAQATNVAVLEGADPGTAGLAARIREMVASTTAAPDSLPIVELPATPTRDILAIVVSGDGGWRDLDRTIGGILQSQGIPTIGLDSLRYFWSRRTPDETARDLGGLIHRYAEAWNVHNVALVGYSFGADVLPAAYLALDPDARARVRQVSLLGLSPSADWEITVSGWLDAGSDAATPTAPALAALPPSIVQCLYGEAESDSPCPALAATGVEAIRSKGGHHFDGNYQRIAGEIIAGLDQRRGAIGSN